MKSLAPNISYEVVEAHGAGMMPAGAVRRFWPSGKYPLTMRRPWIPLRGIMAFFMAFPWPVNTKNARELQRRGASVTFTLDGNPVEVDP